MVNKTKGGPNTSKGTVLSDKYVYFGLHNLLSLLFFFLAALALGLFELRSDSISEYLFSTKFPFAILLTFGISLASGILARILIYFLVMKPAYAWFEYELKKWGDINTKLNSIGMSYYVETFISSFLFALGMMAILVNKLTPVFEMSELSLTVIIYLAIKTGVLIFVKGVLKL